MAKKAKNNTNFIIRCTHCFEDKFKLDDVDPKETVKFYTDTPFKYNLTKDETNNDTKDDIGNKSNASRSKSQNSLRTVSPSFKI